eukprot:TRINITY_DN12963_c0_g1_i1.p1 TRINITY_DN12963_c0_g1~~TRINITY_DN12963_c0_g1_i1.p1  ORF type:complete len:550 (+),score=113.15 TRINITY_DN12963_c0_g1_i1:65-1651(+)
MGAAKDADGEADEYAAAAAAEAVECADGPDEGVDFAEALEVAALFAADGQSVEDSEPEVGEDLRDAIEGTLRLKRLLSRSDEMDDLPEEVRKKRRMDMGQRSAAENAQVSQLLYKWGLSEDALTRHVLENLSQTELAQLLGSNYVPDLSNVWKCPAELLQTHTNLMRESRGPGGGPLDQVTCFRHKWGMSQTDEKLLRGLTHKDLRHVTREYDGTVALAEVVIEAAKAEPAEEGVGEGAVPDWSPGVEAMSRYTRLELIDPVADCAVFGDANLTFSLNLAKHRKALGHVGRVIATTFETRETLEERYKEIGQTIKILEEHYAEVQHGVDCTRIAIDQRFSGMAGSLGAVYYNFPHAGAVGGFFDGHPVVNWRHENLMRLFFRALRSFVKPGGWVKVASNSGAVGVRFSYIVGSAAENEFVHIETFPFLKWILHRYGRSYGDRRDTYKRPGEGEQYNAQRADSDMVYCFVYKPCGDPLPRQQLRLPPTYKTMLGVTDGPLGERQGDAKKKLANELYKRFMLECSGTHVG